MHYEQCHGNMSTDELELARDIANICKTEEECFAMLDEERCEYKCSRAKASGWLCEKCVTVENIYECGIFIEFP